MLEYLDRVSGCRPIKLLIVAGAPDAKGRDDFIAFFKNFYGRGMDVALIHRMYDFIDQLMLKLVELEKFTIYINSGNVLATYLNIGLACDYRILADNAVIQNPDIELGLVAKGGGAYFLPRLIGQAQAWDVILSDKDINAFEAIDIGLIHEVVPSEHFEKIVFRRAEKYEEKPRSALSIAKQLMSFSIQDFKKYLEYENTLLTNIIKRNEFWERIGQI
ncbi:MAG: enoyl-CoA hydratase/isomerase family protein [Desulfobacterales bacterium]|jgi:2-(1,2-epoxy-1,2-dihydrophenyl)acetyl-CoA isomerase